MIRDDETGKRSIQWRRVLPFVGIFAAGLVHTELPRETFGAHDIAVRAVITGATAGVVTAILFLVERRWRRSSQ
jgi:hypothetical protein